MKKVRVGKVKKNDEGEWIVPVYVDNKFNDDMTYYGGTSKEDKEDAELTRDSMIKDLKKSKNYKFTESSRFKVIEIQEEVAILQDDHKIILEKGDKIKVLVESYRDLNNFSELKKFLDASGAHGIKGDSEWYLDDFLGNLVTSAFLEDGSRFDLGIVHRDGNSILGLDALNFVKEIEGGRLNIKGFPEDDYFPLAHFTFEKISDLARILKAYGLENNFIREIAKNKDKIILL